GRKVFNQMLEALKAGEADGIIAWNPDRLARNSKDGGEIIYQIDKGAIKDLKFPTYLYDNSPHGKFNLSLAFGFSKLFIDNLVQNVKRGIREKVKRGEYPGLPPRGYINNPKTRGIDIDSSCFDTIKSLLERYSIGASSIPEIRDELFEQSVKSKSGKPLSYNTLGSMLRNSFYYGVFKLKGELHQGSHHAMISKDCFDRIQSRLSNNGRIVDWSKTTRNKKNFLFSELGKCGECGFTIIREYHKKKTGSEFRYYRCSKKSRTCNCKQKAINEKDLAPQIEESLSRVAINDDWYQWSMDVINCWKNEEQGDLHQQIQKHDLLLKENEIKLERLLDLYIEAGLTNEEYKSKRTK
ncbi:MAG: recombinase zinc beta ribbon domain-containing protein, partial [Cyanobacteria bacterium]|nr:recombinase zinc beta ribbon domain-containing protein [Cyanobacteriota bacterium]